MKSEKGVTLITVVIMIVVMAIIATVSIISGVAVVNNAKEQVKEKNLSDVKVLVGKESAKYNTQGVLTPANTKFYGVENIELPVNPDLPNGSEGESTKEIGEGWFYLNETALNEMGIEYVDETYIVNYKYNVVIPLSTTQDIHTEIEYYNIMNNQMK